MTKGNAMSDKKPARDLVPGDIVSLPRLGAEGVITDIATSDRGTTYASTTVLFLSSGDEAHPEVREILKMGADWLIAYRRDNEKGE